MKLLNLSSRPGRIIAVALAIVLCLLLGWMLRGALNSPANVATITVVGDWRISCPPRTDEDGKPNKASCEAMQSTLEAQSRMNILTMIIADDPDLKKRMLVITVPHDTFLQEGLGLLIGEDQKKTLVYRYEACNQVGCFAKVEFNDKLRETFENGAEKNLKGRVLVARLDRSVLPIDFSLKGFEEAMSAYNTSEAKRHSWFRRLWS